MFEILIYPILTIIFLFFLGYGFTALFLPKKLKEFGFWLSPWLAIVFLIISLSILSLAGLSVKQSSPIIITFLIGLNILALFKRKRLNNFDFKNRAVILVFIALSLVLSLTPLLKDVKFLTTVSMGNNDVIAYVTVSDYLIDGSIFKSFQQNKEILKSIDAGVNAILTSNYRWGTPILASFFLNLYNLKAYQFIYIFQAILFSLAIPLYYVLLKTLYKRVFLGGFLVLGIFTFNSNLIYMLYHNFFGQVLFYGLSPLFFIFIFSYLSDSNKLSKGIGRFDIIIGLLIASLFFAYHEVTILVVVPLFFLLFLKILSKKNIGSLWSKLLKILLITVITSSVSIVNAINVDFLQASNIDAPIGWALFRQNVPFANPFEALGFYSIHSFEPLPLLLAILLSLLVIYVILVGFARSKYKIISFSYILVYLLFFSWTLYHNNFFAYNRVLTYTLPLILILFSIGLIEIFKRNIRSQIIIIGFLLFLELFFAVSLTRRFINEKLIVDKPLISIKNIQVKDIGNEPIYTGDAITGKSITWKNIWTTYFLYSNEIYISKNKELSQVEIPDNSIILISKNAYLNDPLKLVLNNILWQDEFNILGRTCTTDKCLLGKYKDFSKINIGSNNFEDSLFLSGWGLREGNTRWAIGNESSLRLINTTTVNVLKIEAYSLKEPQKIDLYIDDSYINYKTVGKEWKELVFYLPYNLDRSLHKIVFKFSNIYKPIDLGLSPDTRELSVNFRKISLE